MGKSKTKHKPEKLMKHTKWFFKSNIYLPALLVIVDYFFTDEFL